jgi:hypothetical protein
MLDSMSVSGFCSESAEKSLAGGRGVCLQEGGESGASEL